MDLQDHLDPLENLEVLGPVDLREVLDLVDPLVRLGREDLLVDQDLLDLLDLPDHVDLPVGFLQNFNLSFFVFNRFVFVLFTAMRLGKSDLLTSFKNSQFKLA